MQKSWRWCAAAAAVTVLVTACGGGDGGTPPAPAPEPGPSRGDLLSVSPVLELTADAFRDQLSNSTNGQALLAVAGAPKCGVRVHEFAYETVGAANEATNATGAIMAPAGDAPECQGARPVLLYAHGTTTDRNYNIAQIANPGNSGASEGQLLAAVYAAQGFIVVAPNYAGYDKSRLGYHPYLHGDQQSKDMMDALAAAQKAFARVQIQDDDKLLVTGYSQGGYVAMATHKALQQAGIRVTASAPASGPYALAAFGDAMFYGQVNLGATVFVPLMTTAYQKAYGNLYQQPGDIYTDTYATGIESLLPSDQPVSTLFAQGKLPQTAVFSSTPPEPSMENITPPTEPAPMAALFALGFGSSPLLKNETRLAFLQDAMARPDGAVPNATDGLPAAAPAHPLRQALKDNDLRNWTPTSPVLLCGGHADPTVFYSLNTSLMEQLWTAPSPLAPAAGMVTVLDVDSAAGGNDPFAAVKNGFAQAKQARFNQGGANAVVEAYHGSLVPPFCAVAARGFFQQVLQQ